MEILTTIVGGSALYGLYRLMKKKKADQKRATKEVEMTIKKESRQKHEPQRGAEIERVSREKAEKEELERQRRQDKYDEQQAETARKKRIAEEARAEGNDMCEKCLTLNPKRCFECGACLECDSGYDPLCSPCWSNAHD